MIDRRYAALALAAIAMPASAQTGQAAPVCTAQDTLPPELHAWRETTPLTAGTSGMQAPVLEPEHAVRLALTKAPAVTYALRPGKPGDAASYGGLARFTVERAGTWRVALGAGAWIDVVGGGKALPSIRHGHGPQCSGVRKMVDFQLASGTYTLQFAGSREPIVTTLVTRLR